MDKVTRRGLVGGLAAAGVAGLGKAALAAPATLKFSDLKKEGDIACIYHCDFGDTARMMQLLNNVSNHYSVYDANPFEVQLVIVAHSAGIKYFLQDWESTPWSKQKMDAAPYERALALSKSGLRVHLCEITFKRLKIDKAKVRNADFLDFVPSGVATIAALQAKGFGYIKVQ